MMNGTHGTGAKIVEYVMPEWDVIYEMMEDIGPIFYDPVFPPDEAASPEFPRTQQRPSC